MSRTGVASSDIAAGAAVLGTLALVLQPSPVPRTGPVSSVLGLALSEGARHPSLGQSVCMRGILRLSTIPADSAVVVQDSTGHIAIAVEPGRLSRLDTLHPVRSPAHWERPAGDSGPSRDGPPGHLRP